MNSVFTSLQLYIRYKQSFVKIMTLNQMVVNSNLLLKPCTTGTYLSIPLTTVSPVIYTKPKPCTVKHLFIVRCSEKSCSLITVYIFPNNVSKIGTFIQPNCLLLTLIMSLKMLSNWDIMRLYYLERKVFVCSVFSFKNKSFNSAF